MGQYLPHAGTDSIQEAIIALHFQGEFAPDILQAAQDAAQTGLKGTFPEPSELRAVQSVQVSISNEEQSATQRNLAGFEFVQTGPDPSPKRTLRFRHGSLSIHDLKYPGWAKFLSDSLSYIEVLLSAITFEHTPVHAFGLRYRDRYNFRSDGAGVPDACVLFQENSPYLSSSSFHSGPWWHCNTGWFEQMEADRVLHRLRVNSAQVDGVPTATIDHDAICQLQTPRQTAKSVLQKSSSGHLGVEGVLQDLHDRNKQILGDMLVRDMQIKIGLTT